MNNFNWHRSIALAVVAAIFLAIAAAAASCQRPQSGERSKFFTISGEGWEYGDTLVWTPLDSASIDSTIVTADTASIVVAMRHAVDYPYANIWLECSYYAPGAPMSRIDTINIWLADEYGHWHGTGIGVGYQLADTVLQHEPIDLSRPISLRHVMRVDRLPGIEQIGLIIN